jgi:hypothetical protein
LHHLLPAQPLLLWSEIPTQDAENSDRTKDNASLQIIDSQLAQRVVYEGRTKLKLSASTGKKNGEIMTYDMQMYQQITRKFKWRSQVHTEKTNPLNSTAHT